MFCQKGKILLKSGHTALYLSLNQHILSLSLSLSLCVWLNVTRYYTISLYFTNSPSISLSVPTFLNLPLSFHLNQRQTTTGAFNLSSRSKYWKCLKL